MIAITNPKLILGYVQYGLCDTISASNLLLQIAMDICIYIYMYIYIYIDMCVCVCAE